MNHLDILLIFIEGLNDVQFKHNFSKPIVLSAVNVNRLYTK